MNRSSKILIGILLLIIAIIITVSVKVNIDEPKNPQGIWVMASIFGYLVYPAF